MPDLNKNVIPLAAALILILIASCKKEIEEKQVYDNIIYQLDSTKLYSTSADKNKQKSSIQYISILYSDLYSKGIPTNELADLAELNLSLGDKTMSNELVLSHYLNDPTIQKPSESEMRNDVETFVRNTYLLFYRRFPTPYEQIFLVEMINNDTEMKVKDVYTAFILSNEYYYY